MERMFRLGPALLGLCACVLASPLATGCGPAPATAEGEGTRVDSAREAPQGPQTNPFWADDTGRPFVLPPLQTEVEQYELVMPDETLNRFKIDVFTPEQPATFIYRGQAYPVKVRLRGNSSRKTWPKKSWRIELPKGQKFQGRRRLNLLAEWKDLTFMFEKLGFDLLEAMRVPASRAKYVRLVINGQYQGVYLDTSRVDKDLLRSRDFLDDDPTLYRCGRKNCEMKAWTASHQESWEKENNEEQTEPDAALTLWMRAINYTPDPALVAELERHMYVEHYLRAMVMDALISNSVIEDSRSYVAYDAITKKWSYLPWELNNSDGRYTTSLPVGSPARYTHPLVIFTVTDPAVEREYLVRLEKYPAVPWMPVFSNLNTRIAYNKALRQRFIARAEQALAELFNPAVLNPRIEATYELLAPHVAHDPYVDQAKWADMRRYMREYVALREAFVRSELERLKKWKLGLLIESFDPNAGWIELRNRGDRDVRTDGLALTTNIRRAQRRNVPGRLLRPGESARFSAGELGLTLPPEGELGLFDGRSIIGALDVVFYGAVDEGQRYARDEQDPAIWRIREREQ